MSGGVYKFLTFVLALMTGCSVIAAQWGAATVSVMCFIAISVDYMVTNRKGN